MASDITAPGAVRARREALGLTQVSLARLADLSRGTVRNIESGAVAPTLSTWESVEAVLGWAPGSLERIERGQRPIGSVPAEVLKRIWAACDYMIEEWDNDREWAAGYDPRPLVVEFRSLISLADERGAFSDELMVSLTDYLFNFPLHRARQDPWDTAEDDDREKERLVQLFEDYAKAKRRTLQQKITPSRHEGSPASREADGEVEQLPEDVEKMLRGGEQIIDYGSFIPKNSDSLTVVTLLLKKPGKPLSQDDRKYIAGEWNNIAVVFGTISQITDNKSSPQSSKPNAESKPDPWRLDKPEDQVGGSYDEPPF